MSLAWVGALGEMTPCAPVALAKLKSYQKARYSLRVTSNHLKPSSSPQMEMDYNANYLNRAHTPNSTL